MKSKLIIAALSLLSGLGMLAYAGDQKLHTMDHNAETKVITVSIDKENDNPAKVDVDINGEKLSFDLPDLADGETREITTNEGKIIKIIKAKNGSTILIDGQKIKLHALTGAEGMSANIFAFKGDHAIDENSLMISGVNLDEDTRQKIEQALQDAGIEKNINFLELSNHNWMADDGSNIDIVIDSEGEDSGDHTIKIEKRIELHLDSND